MARGDRGPASLEARDFDTTLRERIIEARRGLIAAAFGVASSEDANLQFPLFVRFQNQPKGSAAVLKHFRRRRKCNPGEAFDAITAPVPIGHRSVTGLDRKMSPAAASSEAADLEQVGKIDREQEVQRQLDRGARKISCDQLVKERGARDDPVALDLDRVARQLDAGAPDVKVGVAQVDAELGVFAAAVGVEIVRRLACDPEFEAAQEAGVMMKETERLERRLHDVAADFEDGKALAVDQHACGAPRRQRRGADVIIVAAPDYIARERLNLTPFPGPNANASMLHRS